jgi:hypothetical protein
VKQQLATVRMLFDWLITGQIVPVNPAAAVRGPKHVVKAGKTASLDAKEWRNRLAAIVMLREKVARVNADAAAVVNMHVLPRAAGDVPHMEIELVHGERINNHDGEEWDLKLAA